MTRGYGKAGRQENGAQVCQMTCYQMHGDVLDDLYETGVGTCRRPGEALSSSSPALRSSSEKQGYSRPTQIDRTGNTRCPSSREPRCRAPGLFSPRVVLPMQLVVDTIMPRPPGAFVADAVTSGPSAVWDVEM